MPSLPHLDYGPAATDVRSLAAINATYDLPFGATEHLANPLNEGKPDKIGRDGQELPADVGEALVKLMEAVVHARPRALWRVLAHPDPELRAHLRWCFRNSARVWLAEIVEFIWHTKRPVRPMTLAQWFAPARLPPPQNRRPELPLPGRLIGRPAHAEFPRR